VNRAFPIGQGRATGRGRAPPGGRPQAWLAADRHGSPAARDRGTVPPVQLSGRGPPQAWSPSPPDPGRTSTRTGTVTAGQRGPWRLIPADSA